MLQGGSDDGGPAFCLENGNKQTNKHGHIHPHDFADQNEKKENFEKKT